MRRLLVMLSAGLCLAAIGFPAGASAATAPNDSFTDATVVTSPPFSTTEDTSQATSDPSDPAGCFGSGSVWFSFTPSSDMVVEADTFGSDYDTLLSAWTGTQGALNNVACNDDISGLQSEIAFAATAGTTYYFMAAQCCGSGGGSLQFSMSQLTSPGNDDFAQAISVGGLPFSDTQDLAGATIEPAEPQPGCFGTTGTVWYSFTAGTTQSITANTDQFGAGIAAYTGNSLAGLSQLGCSEFSQPLTFQAQAGTTYYFQVGASSCCGVPDPITFHLNVATAPVAQFFPNPGNPSSFDTVQFIDGSQDPAGAGISSWAWAFGDGATSTLEFPTHRYAADGDYPVHLTVTTPDGRTASTSQVLQVRTHDVAITRLAVPNSAHVGQTIAITVYLQNSHYPETVEVDLSKSVPGGFTQVGSLRESVPVKTAGQTTRFEFSYTVTSDDQVAGKITFRADANIVGQPDALPADNELLSTPVKVS